MSTFLDRITGQQQRVSITLEEDTTRVLSFDAAISETHIGNAATTDHPVEDGADMTDHIQRTPEELQIVGIVSDTPVLFLASLRAQPAVTGGDSKDRAKDAYTFIKEIKDGGKLVQVSTSLRDYTNMAVVGLSVIRDKETSRVVEMALSLREILIATTEQVAAPEPETDARKKQTKQGKKTKQPETEANQTQARSLLASIIG
jgi:hypothetical protein